MNLKRVNRDAIQFEFVPYHTQVEPIAETDRLYLDCGNGLGPGVIDHHHLAAYTGSTAGLIVRHSELIVESIREQRSEQERFVIVVHEQPDLDCVVSVTLAISILTTGTVPAEANALANYVDRVDAGYPGFSQKQPYSLYAAYLLLVHDQAEMSIPDWSVCLQKGVRVVEHVLKRVAEADISIPEVDAFDCQEIFRPRDRREIELDLNRYRAKLNHPDNLCRRVTLKLPGEFGGNCEVDGLLARNVQNINDPNRCVYFKDWARTDFQNSSLGAGFGALSVFVSESENSSTPISSSTGSDAPTHQVRRCILSVAPGRGVTLRGLGALLEQAEHTKRIEFFGMDNRVTDPATGKPLVPRKGFSNSDPWYDGRGHNFTIVDSPRCGTVLTADQIENVFLEFGNRKPNPTSAPEPTPSRMMFQEQLVSSSTASNQDLANSLFQLSTSVENWKHSQPRSRSQLAVPEIFISYPRLRLDWVESWIAKPLVDHRGSEKIFFDKNQLQAGMGWLATLADGVMNCRLFIPVFCAPYFQSDFCQWELQLALTRDPTGRKRIIAPVMLEPVELPAYCRLIQAELFTGDEPGGRLLQLVSEILD